MSTKTDEKRLNRDFGSFYSFNSALRNRYVFIMIKKQAAY